MIRIGVQTQNVVNDDHPEEGFALLGRAGFSCADFSLNAYLSSQSLYQSERNDFFDQSVSELERFFAPHKRGAAAAGIEISQMHMPYPICVPGADKEINDYLWNQVAPKSMAVCHYMGCKYIVVHGFKLARFLGTEELEWQETEKFIDSIAPLAKESGITICIENIYTNIGSHIMEGPFCDARKAAARIDRVNEKYGAEVLGFCFDTGHANLIGIHINHFITMLGTRLKVLHIHDNDGISDLHQIPFTFARSRQNKSSTDWDGFISGLRAVRFGGVLSFETAPVLSSFPVKMKQDVLRFIAGIGDYFAGEIQNYKES